MSSGDGGRSDGREEKKGRTSGDESEEKNDAEDEGRSQNQIKRSKKRVTQLQKAETELVTNIQVAADFREAQRRAEQKEASRRRIEKLEMDAKSSLEKFEEISKRWMAAREKDIPQEVREALGRQQQLCAALLEDKNRLIGQLQQELKASDERYVKDLQKQASDVDLMIERMEEQMKNLVMCHREELAHIEKVFREEREELLSSNRRAWEQMAHERREKELEYLMQRMKKVEECETLLQKLRMEDEEEYNTIKDKLENDVQTLEQQLQQMKATYQLNQEKLEYNFQVLKKRDEENNATKCQQKRKITRLQDVINNLKMRCAKQEKQSREENQALSDAYQRTMQQYRDVQKKMRHFVTIDAKRLEEIWLMNEAEVRGLMEKALEIDCVVHEQQLAVPWARPPLAVADRSGQQGAAHASFPTGLLALQNDGTEHRHLGGLNISAPTLKKLLELLYDETGFFAEGKILTLLVPLEKDERSCVQLDAVIMALGIEDEDDGHQLANFLTKYRQQKMEDVGTAESKTLVGTDEGRSDESWDIHPSEVLAALRVFAAEHHGLRSQPFIFTPPVNWLIPKKTPQRFNRGDTETAAYWEAMANVITEPKLKLWAALDAALGKYHTVLNQRSKLLVETQSLRQQNTELKMLLHQYMNSKVNTELLIPPTQLIRPNKNNLSGE